MPSLRRRRPGGSSSRREYGSRLRTQEARQPQDRREGCPCPTRSHTSSPQSSPAHSESTGQVVPAREGMRRMSCRSEEHTSELQSHSDLVCRLLLEKKNNKN